MGKGPYIENNLLKKAKASKLVFKDNVKTISKNSTLLPKFFGFTLRVYNGKTFITVKIINEMIGHKLGEFVSTRKQFSYKKKKKKKKMGQKVDARIFRQGVNKKNWELKHIEKNKEESSLFLYKTLEIQKYLNRFFKLYKIKVHNCKVFYSDSSLQVFVSFYVTPKIFYVINKDVTKYSKEFLMPSRTAASNKQRIS